MRLGNRANRARISFVIDSMKGETKTWADAIQKIQDIGEGFTSKVKERLFDDFYNTFLATANAKIEFYRNVNATNTPPTQNLFRSIDRKADTSGGLRIFVHADQAPYASIHDKPEGEYTEIRAKSPDKPLWFFFHRESRWFLVPQSSSIMRPGTGFFTSSFFETADLIENLYEDIKDEVVAEYNVGVRKGPLRKRR